jgi:hypothetical protein
VGNFGSGGLSYGTTWLFYGIWTDLITPYSDEGPQIYELDMQTLDPGFNTSASDPTAGPAPITYIPSGNISPL